MGNSQKLVFIVGPTAVGKSALALEFASLVNGEIISCDAMQVYRNINIASNKPSLEEQKKIKHHLIDIVEVEDEFNVKRFDEIVRETVKDILKRGKVPMLVGGSGMYVQILLDGLFDQAQKDEDLRNSLNELAESKGLDFLYAQLKAKDPSAAASIHVHDKKRVIRALEVCEMTGEPFSEAKKKRKGLVQEYEVLIFGLNCDRALLYSKIDQRVEEMLSAGLVGEVKDLKNRVLSLTAERMIGIPQIKKYIAGEYDLKSAAEDIKQRTRNYAKRQLTWFRKEKRIVWIDVENNNVADVIREMKKAYDKEAD